MKNFTLEEQIRNEINAYLDQMPKRSRVNYPDLVSVVMGQVGIRRRSNVDDLAHKIVQSRLDLYVSRGQGIIKG